MISSNRLLFSSSFKTSFKSKYFRDISNSNLYAKLKELVCSPLPALNKQRRIEKLMNVYYLSKESDRFELNPFWWSSIHSIFSDDYSYFSESYTEFLRSDLKTNIFLPLDLNRFFTSQDIFSIIIYCYLNLLEQNNYTAPKTSTFVSSVVVDLCNYHIYQLETFFFSEYIELTYPEVSESIISMFSSNIFSNWKDIFYSYLQDINSTTDIKKTFTRVSLNFNIYYAKQEEKIKRFLYQLVYGSYRILLGNNVFNRSIVYRNKKRYDYSNVFCIDKFNSLGTMSYMNCNLPMLTPPLDWDTLGTGGGYLLNKRSKYNKLTRGLSKGISSISYSAYTIKSINILQKKCYKINKKVLSLFKSDLFFKLEDLLDFDGLYSLYCTYSDSSESYKKVLSTLELTEDSIFFYKHDLSLLYKSRKYLDNASDRNAFHNELLAKHNLTNESFNLHKACNKIKQKFYSELSKYRTYDFFVNICNIYSNENIYTVSNLDFRTRINPLGRCLHRATGIYKHVLSDVNVGYTYTANSLLKLKEYIYLNYKGSLHNYTVSSLHTECDKLLSPLLLDLESTYLDLQQMFLIRNNTTLIYKTPLLDLVLSSKNGILFLLGVNDYIRYLLDPNYVSNLEVDFDQCSSGPMIYSLLSMDPFMGNNTNCFPSDVNVIKDLYTSFLNNFLSCLATCNSKQVLIISSKEYNLCSWLRDNLHYFTRSFSKSLLMPTFYNMGKKGISKLLFALFHELDIEDKSLKRLVSFLTTLLTKQLQKLYPYTIRFQNELMNICNLLYANKEWVSFRTLDGSLLKYKYLFTVNRYGKVSVNNRALTYRIYTHLSKDKELSWRQVSSYPPNYIHSLDASLCRIILWVYYSLTNKILEPLHDCFRVPICELDSVYTVIKYVYLYYFFSEFFHRDKIGLTKLSDTNIVLNLNSKDYNNHTRYFPIRNSKFSNNIIFDTILNHLNVNDSLSTKILNNINMSILSPNKSEDLYASFLNNRYIFHL